MFDILNLGVVFDGMRVFWLGTAMITYATLVLTMSSKPKIHSEQEAYSPPQMRATYISFSGCTFSGNTISGNTVSVGKLPPQEAIYQIGI